MKEEDVIVSPNVLAGTLLIAITVLLGAIISIYVFPIGGSNNPSGPNTAFTIEEEQVTINEENVLKVTFGYNVGDKIDADELKVTVNSQQAYSLDAEKTSETAITEAPDLTGRFDVSNSFHVIGYAESNQNDLDSVSNVNDITLLESGDVIHVIWVDSDGETEQVLREYVVQNNN